MRPSLLLPCAALILLSCSGRDAPTEPPLPAAIAIATSDSSFALAQGDTVSFTLTLTRTNYTGQVQFSATGVPSGLAVTFTPSSVAPGFPEATIELVAGTFASVGSHSIRVAAAGPGGFSAELFLTVVISLTGGVTVSVPDGGLAFDQDDGGQVELTVSREGSFVGPASMSTGELPEGLVAAFLPSSVPGTSTVLALTASPTTPIGTHQVEVIASAAEWKSDTTILSVTIGPQGAITPITVDFCSDHVQWVGYANRNGAWHEATSAGGTMHTVSLSQPTGSIAWFDGATTHVYRGSVAELQQMASLRNTVCALVPPVNEKELSGIAAGVAEGQHANFSMGSVSGGGSDGLTGPDSSYGFVGLPDGPLTLSAIRTGPNLADGRIVVRRGVDLPNHGSIPRLDFDGPEAEPLESATMTFTNARAGASVRASVFVLSAYTLFNLYPSTTFSYQGAPASVLEPGERHTTAVREELGYYERYLALRFTDVVNRNLTFGPILAEPERRTLVSGSPAAVEFLLPVQPEYPDSVTVSYLRTKLTVASGYLAGGDRWELSLPRMTTSPTFDPAWAPSLTNPCYPFLIEAFGTGAPENGASVERSVVFDYWCPSAARG